uniref:Uncharacterized protein n=1 Tax=Nelumbo nucifera TaxID=4432 RepID=A0A822XZ81_NELNU|nr:TPA_asm: hypothetical protein HUJ06_026806 [Nelumbo nucifera]
MKLWKEMKQNGFLSSSHGGIPVNKMTQEVGRILYPWINKLFI